MTNNNYVYLAVKPETKKKILDLAMKELLENRPELRGMYISHDYLLNAMTEYYLK